MSKLALVALAIVVLLPLVILVLLPQSPEKVDPIRPPLFVLHPSPPTIGSLINPK